ncbi:MAG TPA: hypothetical protein VFG56_01175 [Candidatus Saccharimonadales bacterium]|nr:hypothetical protein [Candidatus Saccharimonadales bacterium]
MSVNVGQLLPQELVQNGMPVNEAGDHDADGAIRLYRALPRDYRWRKAIVSSDGLWLLDGDRPGSLHFNHASYGNGVSEFEAAEKILTGAGFDKEDYLLDSGHYIYKH